MLSATKKRCPKCNGELILTTPQTLSGEPIIFTSPLVSIDLFVYYCLNCKHHEIIVEQK